FMTFAAVLVLAACHPAGPPVARLSLVGDSVRVNGGPARDGMAIGVGDQIATGPASSARIDWSDGTWLQLDERTDPIVVWDGAVLSVNVGYGWFLIDTGRMDVRIVNQLSEVVAKSRVAIQVVPGKCLSVFLFSGRVELIRPPGRPLA